ncbi:hypothetical protein QG516_04040 [Pedobacter gandavensis]|uniref:hypothetical protein n=1 Tax=Pedobacter gandavensis TaxID=2679963 RepID=UPI0024787465|nr:hypothetical protein [Pedobacter gandavensis]WGQ10824.1 hypothetical protein QG516_04040 [Pedobacter gandavensis]
MYFKTIPLPFDLNQPQAEESLRKASIKESMSLDFKFKAVDIGTDKIFYGLEGKKDLKFTRLKTSFELFMPKLIVSISKDSSANYYRIRPGAISIAIIGLLGFSVFTGLVGIVRGSTDLATFSPFLIIIVIYALLFLFEISITVRKMNKVLIKV